MNSTSGVQGGWGGADVGEGRGGVCRCADDSHAGGGNTGS